ncbi:MAG: hypothetical protein ACK5QW_00490, partial [Cyanobacteriota bacterium]
GPRPGLAATTAATTRRRRDGVVIGLMGAPRGWGADPASLAVYLNAWSTEIRAGAYEAGLFVTTAIPLANLSVDWLARWEPALPAPMMGFALTNNGTSPTMEMLAGQGTLLRVHKDRRGLTPRWLAMDPRALPPSPPSTPSSSMTP